LLLVEVVETRLLARTSSAAAAATKQQVLLTAAAAEVDCAADAVHTWAAGATASDCCLSLTEVAD